MTALLAALFFFILSLSCYVVYQLQVEKNKRKQHESETRKLLRNQDPDDIRDRKMIEEVRKYKWNHEFDETKYSDEVYR